MPLYEDDELKMRQAVITQSADNTRVARSKVVKPIRAPKFYGYTPTETYVHSKTTTPQYDAIVRDEAKAREYAAAEEKAQQDALNAVLYAGSLALPSRYIGPLFNDNGKSYWDNMVAGEGSGNAALDFITDLVTPVVAAKAGKTVKGVKGLSSSLPHLYDEHKAFKLITQGELSDWLHGGTPFRTRVPVYDRYNKEFKDYPYVIIGDTRDVSMNWKKTNPKDPYLVEPVDPFTGESTIPLDKFEVWKKGKLGWIRIQRAARYEPQPALKLDDVKNWTDKMWDTAYEKAIRNNDIERILQIRDLHYLVKAPNSHNELTVRNGKPVGWFHGTRNAGHTTFNSSVSNATIGGESAAGKEKGNFLTTDIDAAYNYAIGPAKRSIGEFTKPVTAYLRFLNKLGLYSPKWVHPVNRIGEGAALDLKHMHQHEVPISDLKNLSYHSPSFEIIQDGKIYPMYVNPGKTFTVDFKGRPWSDSPVDFPSKYYLNEVFSDVDLTPIPDWPNGHFINLSKNSELTSDLESLKRIVESRNLRGEGDRYSPRGVKAVMSRYRDWDRNLTPLELLEKYSNPIDRPGYEANIFEVQYPGTSNGAVQYGASEGYDAIYMPNIIDANTGNYPNYTIEDLVPLHSQLMKLAVPITYDNGEKVIPISKRDIFNNPDIRY